MDRFGDDLTELILSYLPLKDKIKLECVSKQSKRCVFEKQFVINITDKTKYGRRDKNNSLNKLFGRSDEIKQLDEQTVESVVKKCPNIKRVIILGEVKIRERM